ncbi:MAG TPA: MarR family transcriptional regulator [Rectinemataceae bacterium]|nr:MarR family transcriptional regulator [Rectinemataceae bacterium]
MLFEKDDPARIFELSAGIHLRSRRAAERALRPHGLTYAQYGGLLALAKGGSMSQSALAVALETDTTTAMVVRGSLERKGLVDRESHPDDGRVKMLKLTSKGHKLAAAAMKDIDAFYAKLARLVSDADLKKTLPILERLNELATVAADGHNGAAKPAKPAAQKASEPKARAKAAKLQKVASAKRAPASGNPAAGTAKAPARRLASAKRAAAPKAPKKR